MPRVRDFLYRFRPAGAPGAAAEAGVPIDRTAELTAELEPLFASLAQTEGECTDLRDRARADAAAIRGQQADLARGVISAAEARTAAERAAAAATVQQRAESQAADLIAAAGQEAAAVRQRATSRMPMFVAEAVGHLATELAAQAVPPRKADAS